MKEEFLHHSPPGSDYLGQASCELAIKAACSIPKGGGLGGWHLWLQSLQYENSGGNERMCLRILPTVSR